MTILERILTVIAPDNCIVCGTEGVILCNWCKPDACPRLPSRCYKCQAQTINFAACKACRHKTPLRHVWIVVQYQAVAKELVKNLKFAHKRSVADVLAEYMHDTLPYLEPQTVIVHIPTATSRVRQRGFDQAALIAKTLARKQSLEHAYALSRLGQTRQVGAKRKQRAFQLSEAFWVSNKESIKGKSVLLVDDVLTTGATIEAAAKVLKQSGAQSVMAVAFAQAK